MISVVHHILTYSEEMVLLLNRMCQPVLVWAPPLLCIFFRPVGVALPEVFGVIERFSTYGSVVFTAVLGIYGFFWQAGADKKK